MRIVMDHTRGAAPLYVQLANALQEVISAHRLKAGDLLPSETVLATENELSRATVIKAFDLLIERGLITRRQGKGTFVSAPPMQRALPELTSFSEHVRSLGKVPGSSLLSIDTFQVNAVGRPASPFSDDADLSVVQRLRTVDGVPVGLQRAIVPLHITQLIGLDEHVAANPDYSFYDALRDHGITLESGDETLRAINADPTDADLLDVEEGTALIELVRNSRDQLGNLIEVVRARYLGSQYLYHITFASAFNGENYANNHEETTSGRTSGGLTHALGGVRH